MSTKQPGAKSGYNLDGELPIRMNEKPQRPVVGSEYTLGEEIANSIISGIAAAMSVAGLVVMIVYAAVRGDAFHVVGVTIFGSSLILSNLSSTLYHAIAPKRAKRVFQIFDHLSIYILIAGSYTPILLVNLRGHWGWPLFGLVWALALFGLVIKLTRLDHVKGLSTGSYLAMGWVALLAIKPIMDYVPTGGIVLLVAGGLCYSFGVIFYAWDRLRFNHAIWHVFVLGGNVLHFFAVMLYVIPPAAP